MTKINIKKIEIIKNIRKNFETKTGIPWKNSQGEPDIDYVNYLENIIANIKIRIKDFKMDEITKFYNDCKKSKYGKILIGAVEEMFDYEIIKTGSYDCEIGEGNSFKDKQDWIECRLWELKEYHK